MIFMFLTRVRLKGLGCNIIKNSTDDAMEQVVSGLKLYFDKALGNILLYRFERQQYVELMERHPEKKKSEIYGVEHLLRLFGTVLLISSIA